MKLTWFPDRSGRCRSRLAARVAVKYLFMKPLHLEPRGTNRAIHQPVLSVSQDHASRPVLTGTLHAEFSRPTFRSRVNQLDSHKRNKKSQVLVKIGVSYVPCFYLPSLALSFPGDIARRSKHAPLRRPSFCSSPLRWNFPVRAPFPVDRGLMN